MGWDSTVEALAGSNRIDRKERKKRWTGERRVPGRYYYLTVWRIERIRTSKFGIKFCQYMFKVHLGSPCASNQDPASRSIVFKTLSYLITHSYLSAWKFSQTNRNSENTIYKREVIPTQRLSQTASSACVKLAQRLMCFLPNFCTRHVQISLFTIKTDLRRWVRKRNM